MRKPWACALGMLAAVLALLWPAQLLAQPQPATPKPAAPAPSPDPQPSAPAPSAGPEPSAPAPGAAPKPIAPASAAGLSDQARLEAAKVAFAKGNVLRTKGDFEGALEFYLRSRALVASVGNTVNAAVCLDELEHYDEAYELFAEALTLFGARLNNEQRSNIAQYLDRLRQRLAVIDVRANVTGLVVVDGRPRGTLPLPYGLRVVAGEHTVAIIKEGYETFQTSITVPAQKTGQVDATLKVLTKLGRMQVRDERLTDAELYVDGALIGRVPWEGALKPGQHRVRVEHERLGTAPQQVTVLEGRTVRVKLSPRTLGAAQRLTVEPASAQLYLDDVPVGRGGWSGRLPLGKHQVRAIREGYRPAELTLQVSADSTGSSRLTLERDPEHPIWQDNGGARGGSVWLAVHGGFGLAPTLRSGAETSCDVLTCTTDSLALGAMAGVRFGYELPVGFSMYLDAGYLTLHKTVERELVEGTARYALRDRLRMNGGYLAAGVGVRLPIGEVFDIGAGAMVGAMFQHNDRLLDGTVTQDEVPGQSAEVVMLGDGLTSANLLVRPELMAGVRLGNFRLGLGLAAAVLVLKGPRYPVDPANQLGVLRMKNTNCNTTPGVVCVAATDIISEERAYATALVWLPSLQVGVAFE